MDVNFFKTEFKNNGGILKTAQLAALKADYRSIQKLITMGIIEKIRNGYYKLIEDENEISEAALISKMFPDGVLCMYTALFYYGYSDRTPLNWDIAINKDTSKARFNLDYPFIKPYYMEPDLLAVGISIAKFEDSSFKIFDRDRLICEILKYEAGIDRETFNKAIQAYVNDPKKNITKLIEYAKMRKVTKKVKDIIGVWL